MTTTLGVGTGTERALGAARTAGVQGGSMDAQKQAKLVDGAKQFEAMLLNEMLKPLKFGQAEASDEAADETGGGQSDTIRGFATEAMSKAIANTGGFGLAKQIISQVTAEHKRQEEKKVGTKVW
jgi:flagellar protein FlgJ